MKDVTPVIPTKEDAPPPPSPELLALRKEAGLWTSIQSVIGNASIKAMDCLQAKDILDRLEIEVTRSAKEVEELAAKEMAAKTEH